jgi:hypothetical protein
MRIGDLSAAGGYRGRADDLIIRGRLDTDIATAVATTTGVRSPTRVFFWDPPGSRARGQNPRPRLHLPMALASKPSWARRADAATQIASPTGKAYGFGFL